MALRKQRYPWVVTMWCLFLVSCCVAEQRRERDLKSVFDGRRWFELRGSAAGKRASPFYQGVVACAFNDLHRCKAKLGAVIKAHRKSDEAIEAHKRLVSYYLIHGQYREAQAEDNAVLAIKPGDYDALSILPLLAAFSQSPDQQTERKRPTTLQLQDGGLPFSINGVEATYWFDTGANVSVLSESEAKRFGLEVRCCLSLHEFRSDWMAVNSEGDNLLANSRVGD
jgi:hypothetical protein